MKRFVMLSALVFGVFFFQNSSIQAEEKPEISDYAFEKNILLKNYNKETKIPLDKEVLSSVKKDFSNFAIFDRANNSIPFSLYLEDFKVLNEAKVLEVSSMFKKEGEQMDKSFLSDNNNFTVFSFSERVDRADDSWAIFDLGDSYSLSRIELFFPDFSRVSDLEIRAGNSLDNLKTIINRKPAEKNYNKISLNTPSYRYVKISFWGVNIRVEDVKFTTSQGGFIYFTPKSGSKYKALYGNDNLNFFRFSSRLNEPKKLENTAYFSSQKWSKKSKKDLDNDGKLNEEDNCPFAKNKLQKDSDDDGVGNVCDNAPKNKNYDQTDTDGDGVGDIIDNCELVANPKQKNKDGDQYGDACDGADTDKGVGNELGKTKKKYFSIEFNRENMLYGLGILFVLTLMVFALIKKKK